MSMRVLLVESDTAAASAVVSLLKSEGYDCSGLAAGKADFRAAQLASYDLIIVDVALPDAGGYEIVRRLMTRPEPTPLLVLSGMPERDKRLRGLGIGEDNYLAKPFKKDALLARIRKNVVRPFGETGVILHGGLVANLDTHTVVVEGQPVYLTDSEFDLLALFLMHRGALLTKEAILDRLYGGVAAPERKNIDVRIFRLRKKLAAASGGENFIDTVLGRGYLMRDTQGPSSHGVDPHVRTGPRPSIGSRSPIHADGLSNHSS